MLPNIQSLLAFLASAALCAVPAAAQSTSRVSLNSLGAQGDLDSTYSSLSADGRYVAFASYATNQVSGDTNGRGDIFVRDLQTGQTTRVSVDSAGVQGNLHSNFPHISADGRFVAFGSAASNLVPGDSNDTEDVFVHDRQTGQTSRVSVDSSGAQANGFNIEAHMSSDGRFVAFASLATNLVLNDTNGILDVFVHDRQTGQTRRVSVASTGTEADWDCNLPSISDDGRIVAFYSSATNLTTGDGNLAFDVFVHDIQTGQTSRVSVDSAGTEGADNSFYPGMSPDGRFVTFYSHADNLVPGDTNLVADVFLHDRLTGATERVSLDSSGIQGNETSELSSVSADGRYVAFASYATNLVEGDTNGWKDVFLRDRQTGETTLLNVTSAGVQGRHGGFSPSITPDGRWVVYWSPSHNLVPGDTNTAHDVFLRDLLPTRPLLTLTGGCPGTVSLTISQATAGQPVAILHGTEGYFLKTQPPCQGLLLEVTPPALATVRIADASGAVVLTTNAPVAACGRTIQAVDVATCTSSNVVVL